MQNKKIEKLHNLMDFFYFKLVYNEYYLESLKIREIFYINQK